MIVIREKTQGRKKYYEKLISKDGKSFDLIDTVIYRLVKVKSDSRDYFVLYTDEQESISPFFQYVNFEIGHLAYNTREQAAHALRQLYCYISLIKSDISKLKKKDIINMQFFLLGYSPKKGEYSFQLESMRRNNTVNDYISIYRAYFSFLGIDCPYLTESKITEYISKNAMGDDISQRVQTYAASLKEGTPVRRVPKYISIEDFGRIINIIRQDNNVTTEIIVRLMFEYGLRLGEVLGITNEDVTENKALKPKDILYVRRGSYRIGSVV